MKVKELKWNGLIIWPPQWAEKDPGIVEHGLLKSVEILPITNLIKIDADYAGTIFSGLILSSEEYLELLSIKLKENIGKPLTDVEDLELYF